LLLVVFATLPAVCGRAQNRVSEHHPMFPQPIDQAANDNPADPSASGSPANERLLRALNADRQKALVSDTNKLLRLVSELNSEIAARHLDALTPEQVHKMSEIEKLAHSVKEKMSASVRGMPAFQLPFQPAHN